MIKVNFYLKLGYLKLIDHNVSCRSVRNTGLSPIQKGTPWPIQSAFVSAVLYFFIVKDRDGPVGIAVRSVVGDLSATAVSTFIVGMQVLTLSSQVIFDDPNANFLTPVHRYSYYFLGLQGPPTPPATVAAASDVSKAKDIDVQKKPAVSPFRKFVLSVRAVAAVLFGVYLLSWRIPPVSLPAIAEVEVFQKDGAPHVTLHTVSGGLTAARSVGVCQWPQLLPFPAATQCPPHLLRLEEHYPCVNDTCGASVEDALRHNVSDNLKFRLAVHPAVAGVTAGVATVEWATTLPVDLDEGKQYQPESASLYLSRSSELYLVSHAQFSGTIFTPARITARLLWRGQPAITCVNKTAPGEGRANVTVKPAEAEALFLDPTSGAPRIRCSDGSSVELVIGEVYKPTPKQQMHLDTPVSPPVPVSSSSIKAEL